MTTEPQYRVIADKDSTTDLVSANAAHGDRLVYEVIDDDRWSLIRIERPVRTDEWGVSPQRWHTVTSSEQAVLGHTPRGFPLTEIKVADYPGEQPRTLQVQESSLASERKVWLGQSDGPGHGEPGRRFHLNEVEARQVRDALTRFLGDGPFVSTRPHFCTPGCTEDSCPVDPLTDAEIAELRSILTTRSLTLAAAAQKQ